MTRILDRKVPLLVTAAMLLALNWGRAPISAASPDSAPALPAPTGRVVSVSTLSQLQSAIGALRSGDTIMIAAGTYTLSGPLYINGTFSNVTVRGASNNRNDVVIAAGNAQFGLWTGGNVSNVTIANLTIKNSSAHPINFNAGTQAPRVYNVRLVDAGQQFIKSNPNGTSGVDNGIVEYSVFEYTTNAPTSYTNGVDVHSGRNWIIRHNTFRRIRAAQGQLAGPALLMWNGSSGSIAEGNTFIDCQREIAFGLVQNAQNGTGVDHSGGIIRNNFIYRNAGMGGDVAIGVFGSPNTKVVHNTILLNGTYSNAIEPRFSNTTGVSIVNNLGDRGVQVRDGATASQQGNVWTATAALFNDPSAGDLHLKSTATAAIDKGVSTSDAPADWDGQTRSGAQDLGADEYSSTTTPPPPQPEVCGDGIDNDGDGQVDEGCTTAPPVACTVSGWSSWEPTTAWSACSGGTQTRTERRTRTIVTPPANGGAACPALQETRTASQACTTASPVACTVSSWSSWEPTTAWSACSGGTQTRTERRTRTIVTPPANGGTACPSLQEARTVSQSCSVAPPPTPPAAPTRLTSRVRNSTVTFNWLAPISGRAPTGYRIEAGLRSGATDITMPVGNTTTATVPNVGRGRYYVRVRAFNASGQSSPSNEVVVSVGCSSRPRSPQLATTVNGQLVSFAWTDPDGCSDTRYMVKVGSEAGLSNLVEMPFDSASATATAPPGTYYVRVTATNELGESEPSNEVKVVVNGGACTPPSFATNLAANVAGSMVTLDWGPASPATAAVADQAMPIGYVLEVGSQLGASNIGVFPMGRTTTFTTAAPPGTYFLRVRPIDACGLGRASDDLIVQVP